MPRRSILPILFLLSPTPILADPPDLAFRSAGEGYYEFNTGVVKGTLKLDGKFQGLYPMVDVATDRELTRPPGVFSFYRVFSTNHRFGNAARDWPTLTKLLPDGAVEVRWPPAEEHPLEITAVYRWSAADTLDLEIAVRPQEDMPEFELFMSSYFINTFRASVYMKPEDDPDGKPRFVPVDRKPDSQGGYVMFPRDQEAVEMIRDGRWTIPPSPVDWAVERWLAAPMALRRDAAAGLTALMMCPPDDCFAVSSPWNPASPEAGGYRSLYLSLFGRDIEAGQTAQARCRLVLARNLTDEEAVRRYQKYLQSQSR